VVLEAREMIGTPAVHPSEYQDSIFKVHKLGSWRSAVKYSYI